MVRGYRGLARLLLRGWAEWTQGNPDMHLSLDQLFAPHLRALKIGEQRLGLLAANIANADTPHYQARDIDFRAAMQSAEGKSLSMQATRVGHIGGESESGLAEALYRVPLQPSLDGNTVDPQKESVAVAETSIRYEAALRFLNEKIRGLQLAITGGR